MQLRPFKFRLLRPAATADTPSEDAAPWTPLIDEGNTLTAQLRLECEAMARFVLQHAIPTPPELIAQVATLVSSLDREASNASTPRHMERCDARLRELTFVHRKLAQAVAPATPQGITVLDQGRRQTRFAWLGPVPLIRMLTVISVVFLLGLIATALPAEVSSENMARGLLDYSGWELFLNMLFLLNCAGIGASFGTLFHAHQYIANSTYDPKYDASYAARLILGLIAGVILVELLPSTLFKGGALDSFGRPTLAMLGGFSATAVQRLLQRLVDALETLVRGDPSAQIHAQMGARQAHTTAERLQSQNEMAAKLLSLQQSLDSGVSLTDFRQRLADLTKTMLSPEHTSPPQAANPTRNGNGNGNGQ